MNGWQDDVALPFAVCSLGLAHGKRWSLCRVPRPMHTAKITDSVFFLFITYMVPQIIQHFTYITIIIACISNKHRRHLILSKNAQIQINSSIVHQQPQVQVKSIQVHMANSIQVQVQSMSLEMKSIQLTGPTAAAAAVAGAAATSAGAAM